MKNVTPLDLSFDSYDMRHAGTSEKNINIDDDDKRKVLMIVSRLVVNCDDVTSRLSNSNIHTKVSTLVGGKVCKVIQETSGFLLQQKLLFDVTHRLTIHKNYS